MLLFLCPLVYSQEVEEEDFYDPTFEAELAIKNDRCQDALNILIDKEVNGDTLNNRQLLLKANALTCLGSISSALDVYGIIIKSEPQNPDFRIARLAVLIASKNWKNAIHDCRILSEIIPNSNSYTKVCCMAGLETKSYDEAMTWINKYLNVNPENEEAQFLQSKAYQGLHNNTQALLIVNRLLEKQPKNSEYVLHRAQLYDHMNMYKFAVGDYNSYLKSNPNDGKVWYQLGLAHQKEGAKNEACSCFEKARDNGATDARRQLSMYCKKSMVTNRGKKK